MYRVKCVICNKTFGHAYPHTKTCSKECRKLWKIKLYGRYGDKSITSGTVGAISELVASADLMKKGFAVFRALSPACFCDLIAFKEDKLFRIEVKTGYMSNVNGKISLPPISNRGSYDILAIYVRQENQCFYRDNQDKEYIF